MADPLKLEKAHFVNCVENTPESTFVVQFNPKELKLDDRAHYSPDQAEQSGTRQDFNGRDGAKLAMELIFDTTRGWDGRKGEPTNVNEQFVKPLRAFLTLAEAQSGDSDRELQEGEDRPPVVQFVWGPFEFTGVIDSINTTFLMFSSQGVPVRARVSVSMVTDRPQSATGNAQTDQTALLPAMVRRISGDAGDSLGTIAQRSGVSEKSVLLANGVDDPFGDLPLDDITIPDSSEMAERIRDAFRDLAPKSLGGITTDDVLEAIETVEEVVEQVDEKLDEARQALETAKDEAQALVDEANEEIREINEAVDDVEERVQEAVDKLPERIRPDVPEVPDIPEIPDIPDFEPPF